MLYTNIEVVDTRLKRQGAISIGFEVPFETICSVPKKPYGGRIMIGYSPTIDKDGMTKLVEWNSFAKWVESLRDCEYLAEELAQAVAQVVFDLVTPERLTVSVEVESSFHLPVVIEVCIP